MRLAECKIDPIAIYCDFEKALIAAVKEQFPHVPVIGCLFHWKQAIRRHMVSKLKMDARQVTAAMAHDVLDALTIVPREEIMSKGIPCVKEKLNEFISTDADKLLWDKFWAYFVKFWCSSEEFVATWNINDGGDFYDVHNRTNNGIER